MDKDKSYAGIDCFRMVAALLVITIHTSPLLSLNETADFILTRVIARVAVPFFFMTSGFFLIPGNFSKLKSFVQSTLKIYAVAILIYIPVNIYNGYFTGNNLFPKIIKDLVFDGTVYHLWYLPAAVLGGVISWYLVRKTGCRMALFISAILYLAGLFGDSYYGLAKAVPAIKGFYDIIFRVTDYTRNGIFYAPVFFSLGGYIAEHPGRPSAIRAACGLAVSFVLMLTEALTLRHYGLMRHDSMYLFLLPCMFFLFNLLLLPEGRRSRLLRTSSMIIYIIHPMAIIGVRLAARLTRTQALFVDNSLVHFAAVSLTSVAAGLLVSCTARRLWHSRGGCR